MRNPAIDPKPGDIVRSTYYDDKRERHVNGRDGNNIYYLAVTAKKTSKPKICWITTWQDWCAKNKVEFPQLSEVKE